MSGYFLSIPARLLGRLRPLRISWILEILIRKVPKVREASIGGSRVFQARTRRIRGFSRKSLTLPFGIFEI
jgi:hypothetical protein